MDRGTVDVLVSLEKLGVQAAVTTQLLSVAILLAAFSGSTSPCPRSLTRPIGPEFFSDADRELERVLAVRSVYRTALEIEPGAVLGAASGAVSA